MSFWSQNPGPTWVQFLIDKLFGTKARILRNSLPAFQKKPESLNDIQFQPMDPAKENEYRLFLKENFRTAIFSYYVMPPWSEDWIGVEARKDGILIGTIVSMKQTTETVLCQPPECSVLKAHCALTPHSGMKTVIPELAATAAATAGIIDLYCVHHSYKKSGIGSRLLYEIDVLTSKAGRLAHIFLKEGKPLWFLPPIKSGQWVWRIKRSNAKNLSTSGKIKLADFNERTIPLNDPIGYIDHLEEGVTQEEIDTACNTSPYKIVMATRAQCPSWQTDSYFYWYAYNWSGS